MELRLLQYFLAVAEEESITKAAKVLNITQPTLSRQLSDLEDELGTILLKRGKRKVTLTDDGIFFRKRAEEIVNLTSKTISDLSNSNQVAGDLNIGAGESASIKNIINVCHNLQLENPDVHFNFTSGDSLDLLERLDRGLFDLCIIYGDVDYERYEALELPYKERWGLLFPNNLVLANKKDVNPSDLNGLSLIVPRQNTNHYLNDWLKQVPNACIKNTYNLINNAILMAESGMGYIITLENVANIKETGLTFRALNPEVLLQISIVWKKNKPLSKVAKALIEKIENLSK